MLNYKREFDLPEGRVVIQALTVPFIEQTSELLATSFVAAVSYLAPYAAYVRRNIAAYLREHQALPPRALVLVAVLQPAEEAAAAEQGAAGADASAPAGANDGGGGAAGTGGSDGGGGGAAGPGAVLSGSRPRVIGTAEVSFSPSTRSSQPFLDAPARCAYLTNMAVSPVFRRKGVASRLLAAAEEVAAGVQGERSMYLHLRFVDETAAKLYESTGFTVARQHPLILAFLGPFVGIQRMKLMVKPVSAPPGGAAAAAQPAAASADGASSN
ncbi:hypothetical protein HYH02_005459 [Chlamydomonas schloesseri]|uniref:N-acetyltransferase domain-containing protein n=1 Tax=Chlamydomonas schloesseri TaxID=2026947 RepID=A0A836B6S4_9CHLO|nr:hypothetical protein HYH02_005459 [Chlamydomonas schloesseri]|eukprot:KAG2449302.1 hypothetical protein HYH02_005459 [Chlamydomonas schloesseri]